MTDLIAIQAGTIYTPTEEVPNGTILIHGQHIVKVGPRDRIKIPSGAQVVEDEDCIAVPGFIDMHIHGAAGHDLMEATPEAVAAVASYLARHGTTSFLATTVSARLEHTLEAAHGLGQIIHATQILGKIPGAHSPGAQPIGIHFEGPFLNVERRGAHPAAQIRKPSAETLQQILEAAVGTARVVTLAPEKLGALDLLKQARSRSVAVGIGHSNATYDEAERAIDAGATHATHLYNAMRPFSHRDPGIIGAALTDDRVSAELICDGVHVNPAAVRLLLRAKGPERVILVSDSLSAAGMPDGKYKLGSLTIQVVSGVCRTAEGALAGSTLTLDTALRNLSAFAGIPYRQCLCCATLNPAKILGIEKQKGVIAPGVDADIAILDQNYYVMQAYVRGTPVL